jgi:hypothetical protein
MIGGVFLFMLSLLVAVVLLSMLHSTDGKAGHKR